MTIYSHPYVQILEHMQNTAEFYLDTCSSPIQDLVHNANDEVIYHLFDLLELASDDEHQCGIQAYDVSLLLNSMKTKIDGELYTRWKKILTSIREIDHVPEFLTWLTLLFGTRNDPDINDQILTLLSSYPTHRYTLIALSVLSQLKDERLLPWIAQYTPDRTISYRRYLVFLAPFSDSSVSTILIEAFQQEEPTAVYYASNALINHPISNHMKACLFRDRIRQVDRGSRSPDGLFALSCGIGRYGSPHDIDELIPFYNDQRLTSQDEITGWSAQAATCHLTQVWNILHPQAILERSNNSYLRHWALHGLSTLGKEGFEYLYTHLQTSLLEERPPTLRTLAHVPTLQARMKLEASCHDVGILFSGERIRDTAQTALAEHLTRWKS